MTHFLFSSCGPHEKNYASRGATQFKFFYICVFRKLINGLVGSHKASSARVSVSYPSLSSFLPYHHLTHLLLDSPPHLPPYLPPELYSHPSIEILTLPPSPCRGPFIASWLPLVLRVQQASEDQTLESKAEREKVRVFLVWVAWLSPNFSRYLHFHESFNFPYS